MSETFDSVAPFEGQPVEEAPILPYQKELDMVVSQVLEYHPQGHILSTRILVWATLGQLRARNEEFSAFMNILTSHPQIAKAGVHLYRISPSPEADETGKHI